MPGIFQARRILRKNTLNDRMRDLYFRLLSRLLSHLYYHRVRLINPELRPPAGPTLYLGLHRNGAVDGYVYKSLFPKARFMISVQLRRSLIGRFFFDGIEVIRDKDSSDDKTADGNENHAAIDACLGHLQRGGALFIMPEGTSDLGHRHLPFKKGAARILAAALQAGIKPHVVPVGLYYERAWAWQSDVEVVLGPRLDLDLPPESSGAVAVNQLQRRITSALEALAVAAPDGDSFARRERIAYTGTLGTGRSYFSALKVLETGVPEAEEALRQFEQITAGHRLFTHQDVPLLPIRHAWAYALYALLLAPLVGVTLLLNLLPLLAAWAAGKRFADARNTITLWRLLVGFPVFFGLTAASLIVAAASGQLLIWGACALVSWLGLRSIYRLKKLAVSLGNFVRAPALRQPLLALHEKIDQALRARGI